MQKSSIGSVIGRFVAGIVGGLGLAVFLRRLRRRGAQPAPDPAEDLRRKLEESRGLAGEQDTFEGEPTVDEAGAPGDIDARRRGVHERARAALDDMRDLDGA